MAASTKPQSVGRIRAADVLVFDSLTRVPHAEQDEAMVLGVLGRLRGQLAWEWEHVAPSLKSSRAFCLAALAVNSELLRCMGLRGDAEACMVAAGVLAGVDERVPNCFSPSNSTLKVAERQTPELCRVAVRACPAAIGYVVPELVTPELDRMAVETAIEHESQAELRAVFAVLKKRGVSPELALLGVRNFLPFTALPRSAMTSEVAEAAVSTYPSALAEFDGQVPELEQTEAICVAAVSADPQVLPHVRVQTPAVCAAVRRQEHVPEWVVAQLQY
jgi:hypothetical protein